MSNPVGQTIGPLLTADPFVVMSTVGLIAFALVGATRDPLVTRVPLALRSLDEISLGVFGVCRSSQYFGSAPVIS